MKPENELFREFDDNNFSHIYSVIDKKTGVNISGLMLIKNDVLAVEAFKNFIEEQAKAGNIKPYSEYSLQCLGVYNNQINVICESVREVEYEICTNHDDLETYWNNIVELCRQDEE